MSVSSTRWTLATILAASRLSSAQENFFVEWTGFPTTSPPTVAQVDDEYGTGISISGVLGPGVGGLNTVSLQPAQAGSWPISSITVNVTGLPGRYLAVKVYCPEYPTKRVPRIRSGIAAGSAPVTFSVDRIGSLGTSTASTEFRFAGYGLSNTVFSTIADYEYTGSVHASLIATGTPGGGAGNTGDSEKWTIGGNWLGDITFGGTLEWLDVAGTIGSAVPARTVSISARRLGNVVAREIYANITTNPADGVAHRVETTDGPFVGTLSTRYINNSIGAATGFQGIMTAGTPTTNNPLAGQLVANVSIGSELDAATSVNLGHGLAAGRTVTIGYGLLGNMILPANGLQGQVIINAQNFSTATWSGSAAVDGITLAPSQPQPIQAPYYQRASASLGGGAVGLVPYDLHDEDCSPPNATEQNPGSVVVTRFCHLRGKPNGTFLFSAATDAEVTLRFYGPLVPSDGVPLLEMRRADNTGWDAISFGQQFLVDVAPPGAPREVRIRGKSIGFPAAHWGVSVPSGVYARAAAR